MQKRELIYATTNPAKLKMMSGFLESLNITVTGLEREFPEVAEGEKSPLLNAKKKAEAYYNILKAPVFSCDSGLFFEGLPDEYQPGTNVRVMGGKRLTDGEMIEYYSTLAKRFGRLVAQYKNAICLILGEHRMYCYDGEDLRGEKFIVSDVPHKKRVHGFPIDSLSIHIDTQKYYLDLPAARRGFSMEKGFCDFFKRVLDATV